jgi:hypothetical protein
VPAQAERGAPGGITQTSDDGLARQEINDILLRYCRGIDRRDRELIRSAYHRDSHDDHGNFRGSGWDFADWAIGLLGRRDQVTTHLISNVLIEVTGATARSECYFVGVHVLGGPDGARTQEFHGRYLDRFERRDGRWGITRRLVVHDWNETRLIVPVQSADDARFTRGAPFPDDAVYSF